MYTKRGPTLTASWLSYKIVKGGRSQRLMPLGSARVLEEKHFSPTPQKSPTPPTFSSDVVFNAVICRRESYMLDVMPGMCLARA